MLILFTNLFFTRPFRLENTLECYNLKGGQRGSTEVELIRFADKGFWITIIWLFHVSTGRSLHTSTWMSATAALSILVRYELTFSRPTHNFMADLAMITSWSRSVTPNVCWHSSSKGLGLHFVGSNITWHWYYPLINQFLCSTNEEIMICSSHVFDHINNQSQQWWILKQSFTRHYWQKNMITQVNILLWMWLIMIFGGGWNWSS